MTSPAHPSRVSPSLRLFIALFAVAILPAAEPTAPAAPRAPKPETVILDATGVANLRIQTAVVEPGDFEETIFALGRIEVYPGRRAVISSRIPGRALEVHVKHDHFIKQGDLAVLVESRQFDESPPAIRLNAPISGLVSATHVVPGEPVSPDKILAEIIDLTEVYALARVPEHLAGRLRSGQKARITVAATGETYVADLEHLGALADAETGTVEAAFHVANPRLALRPGMRAEFSIVVATRTEVTSIPRAALQGDPAARFVYVKHFELPHAFVKAPVVVGQTNDRSVEILRGLLPADEVVTQGAYSLAFAGGGTLSLKAALDAAHGHEHAADGSELKPDQPKKTGAAPSAAHDHGHDHDDDHAHPQRPWQILSAVLFVALLVITIRQSRRPSP
jgi:multidrug efflux pump subunit AcrA (membrane-fusion protein)